MAKANVTSELLDIGDGVYAYVASSGTWGWSNAGLITDGESSLLVDTLFTISLTQRMLDVMARSVPAAKSIDILVNSHADGDHTWGNQLVNGAQIIATESAADDMRRRTTTPEQTSALVARAGELGMAGKYMSEIFAPFDFSAIELTPPNTTFTGDLVIPVGDKCVKLIELGPAHSRGDLVVYAPDDRVAFVADLLFVGAHPLVWAGPISNWIGACDRILKLDVDVIVPGHGQVIDKAGMIEFRDYLVYIDNEARRLHQLERTVEQAAREIDLSAYAAWGNPERIVVAIDTTYRELNNDTSSPDRLPLFGAMGELAGNGR